MKDNTIFIAAREAGLVKGFGCRPRRTVRRTLAAGVRKPPGEETAMWERVAVAQRLMGII